jgi:hypothetical protein
MIGVLSANGLVLTKPRCERHGRVCLEKVILLPVCGEIGRELSPFSFKRSVQLSDFDQREIQMFLVPINQPINTKTKIKDKKIKACSTTGRHCALATQ